MNNHKTIRIEHAFTEARLRGDGSVEIEHVGHTAGGKAHKIVLKATIRSLGYMAESFHKALDAAQAEINEARRALKGGA